MATTPSPPYTGGMKLVSSLALVASLALAEPFAAHAQRTGEYLHGFERNRTLGSGHWNERGHELAGKLVGDWVVETFERGR